MVERSTLWALTPENQNGVSHEKVPLHGKVRRRRTVVEAVTLVTGLGRVAGMTELSTWAGSGPGEGNNRGAGARTGTGAVSAVYCPEGFRSS